MSETPKGTRPVPKPISTPSAPITLPPSPYELPPGRPPDFVTSADIPEPPKLPDELPPQLEQKCCPDVATFEGSTGPRRSYYGFDDKTNAVRFTSKTEYWVPPTAEKSLPGDKETIDGARWVSVAKDLETQLEINFDGSFTAGCLANCTYEIEPASIAEVVGAKPLASGVIFKIKGKEIGEASLKVMCEGKLRGYFHIWCALPARLTLNVVNIVSNRSRAAVHSIAELQKELRETFGQMMVYFRINDLGVIDISSGASGEGPEADLLDEYIEGIESAFYDPDGNFNYYQENLLAISQLVNNKIRSDPDMKDIPEDSITLYYYTPEKIADGVIGSVINVGASPAFTFIDDPTMSYNTSAHELGHVLGLVHPSDTETLRGIARTAQYPPHHLDTLVLKTENMPATNTEPAVPANEGGSGTNILASDPLNLMGYWIDFQQAKPLRYRQWKSCRRTESW